MPAPGAAWAVRQPRGPGVSRRVVAFPEFTGPFSAALGLVIWRVSMAARDLGPFVISRGSDSTEIPMGWVAVVIALVAAALIGIGILATVTSWLDKLRDARAPDERRRFALLFVLGALGFGIVAAFVFLAP